jgi:uncharacterized protein YneR
MRKPRHIKFFSQVENNKKVRIYNFKGGLKVALRKPYSLKRDKKKKIIRLLCGEEEIFSFNEGVSPGVIKRRILRHKLDQNKKKKGGFIEAIEERNAKQAALKNKENKITFFNRNHTGRWI